MKRGLVIVGVFVLLISFSFVSAGFFEDLLGSDVGLSPAENSLVVHYEFESESVDVDGDGSPYLSDSSIGDNWGYLRKVTLDDSSFVPGKFGDAFNFDGSSYVEIEGSEDWDFEEFTMSAWIKKDSDIGNWKRIMGKYSYTGDNRGWAMDIESANNDGVRCYIVGDNGGISKYLPEGSVPKDEWIHVACTFDGNELRMFVNGEKSGDPVSFAGKTFPKTDSPIMIGSTYWDGKKGESPFKGDIDDVRIYDRALEGKEVESLYESFVSVDECTLKSCTIEEGTILSIDVYDVSIDFVGTSQVKLNVNGEVTNSLAVGDSQVLDNGVRVEIIDITVQDYAGGIKQVTFSLVPQNYLILQEGSSTTLTVGGIQYTTSIYFISSSSVKLDINGEVTNSLAVGDSQVLDNGVRVEIIDITVQDYAGGIKQVTVNLVYPTLDSIECTQGCEFGGKCLPIGVREIVYGGPSYCGLIGVFESQKFEDDSCQNSYECQSNLCSNGVCIGTGGGNLGLEGECSDGCSLRGECIPVGIRQEIKDGKFYCDVDLEFKNQKSDNQVCQNDYECSNNICTDGRCIPIGDYIQEVGRLQTFFSKLLCFIGNPFNEAERSQCVVEALEEEARGDGVLIERDIFELEYLGSQVVNDCELLENYFDASECSGTHVAEYTMEGVDTVSFIIERHVNDLNHNEIVGYFDKIYSGLELEVEPYGDRTFLAYLESDSSVDPNNDVIIAWISGRDVVAIGIDNWNEGLVDDDFLENFFQIYADKYPSTLVPVDECTLDSCTIDEGDEVTIKGYDISVNFISSSQVKLNVNGEVTNSLAVGDSQVLSDGTVVKIIDIAVQDYAGGIKQVTVNLVYPSGSGGSSGGGGSGRTSTS